MHPLKLALEKVFQGASLDELLPLKNEPLFQDQLLIGFKGLLVDLVEKDKNVFQSTDQLLDIALQCSELGHVDSSVPLVLIEDLLDMVTIASFPRIFDYLESRKERLTRNMEPNRGKGLILLRFCNESLKRLSKSGYTELCGRILTFLSLSYPLTERSGVNLKGEFNIENGTVYDEDVLMDDPHPEKRTLYQTIWGLQKFFSNPPLLFQPGHLELFQKHVQLLNCEFEKYASQDLEAAKFLSSSSVEDNELFFPKFLTSWNLFDLQLKDIHFRRQIVIQEFIMIQFLASLFVKEKERFQQHAKDISGQVSRNVMFAFTMTPEQESWVISTRSTLLQLLDKMSLNGKQFARTVITAMSHDKNWVLWKNLSCPNFELPPVDLQAEPRKIKLPSSVAIKASHPQTINLGTEDLTRLWKVSAQVETILHEQGSSKSKKDLKEALVYLEDQLDENGNVAEGVEEEYLYSKDPQFNWKVYRIASESHYHLFEKIKGGINTRSLLQLSLGRELPSQEEEEKIRFATQDIFTREPTPEMQQDSGIIPLKRTLEDEDDRTLKKTKSNEEI